MESDATRSLDPQPPGPPHAVEPEHVLHQVIERMTAVLVKLERDRDAKRFFLRTYLRTTQAVAAELELGGFRDADWVARWDAAFAAMYVDALEAWTRAEPTPPPWRVAFAAADDSRLSVERHVLLGMNAHVNYDLPAAIAQVISDTEFADPAQLRQRFLDHVQVDAVLLKRLAVEARLIAADQGRGSLYERLTRRMERRMAGRFLPAARAEAWANAGLLARARAPDAQLDGGRLRTELAERTAAAAELLAVSPRWPLWAVVLATLIPGIPALALEMLWTYRHSEWWLLWGVLTVSQVGESVFRTVSVRRGWGECKRPPLVLPLLWNAWIAGGAALLGRRFTHNWWPLLVVLLGLVRSVAHAASAGARGVNLVAGVGQAALLAFGLRQQWRRLYHDWAGMAFPHLSEALLADTAARLQRRRFAAGDTVLRQGEPADCLYIVTHGEVVVMRRGDGAAAELATLGPGQLFGEIGLLSDGLRTASVRARGPVELLALDAATFQRMLRGSPATGHGLAAVAQQHLVADMLRSDRPQELRSRRFEAGETIVRQGEPADCCYIVARGELRVVRTEADGRVVELPGLAAGHVFGELGLLHGVTRTATVVARTPVEVLTLDQATFRRVIAESPAAAESLARLADSRLPRASLPLQERPH